MNWEKAPVKGTIELPKWLSAKESACIEKTWVSSLSQEDALEKEMATFSTMLVWEIPWTKEPGRLQSMGSQRVRHNLSTETTMTEVHIIQRVDAFNMLKPLQN